MLDEKQMKSRYQRVKKWVGRCAQGNYWCNVPPNRPDGYYIFEDCPSDCNFAEFKPNLNPSEVLHLGSFGGGYFRDIKSSITKESYKDVWKELPADWIDDLDVSSYLSSPVYNKLINKFKVDCGAKLDKSDAFGLKYWESKSWIVPQDPYGWFMWYCRFFEGRRSPDDSRQIKRWISFAGSKGRFKINLVNKIIRAGAAYDDPSVSPVIRQSMQHWAYRITADDVENARQAKATPDLDKPSSNSDESPDTKAKRTKRKRKR